VERCTFSGNSGFCVKICDFAEKLILDGEVDLDYLFKAGIVTFVTTEEAAGPEGAKITGNHEIPHTFLKIR